MSIDTVAGTEAAAAWSRCAVELSLAVVAGTESPEAEPGIRVAVQAFPMAAA